MGYHSSDRSKRPDFRSNNPADTILSCRCKWGHLMVAGGQVKNGVVVLDNGVRLPEGLEVTVLAPDSSVALNRGRGPHSVLDIPTVNLGAVLEPLTSDDDLLEEMLEGRGI
jgi:hypothetical protein